MTPEERIDADNRSVYVGNVRHVHPLSYCAWFVTTGIWRTVEQIPGRLWSYCRWVRDPFQRLWACEPSDHPVWPLLRPPQGVGSTFAVFKKILFATVEHIFKCWHPSLFVVSVVSFPPFSALPTLSSLIKTLCRVPLVCTRPCSEEESLRWGASHYMI